MDIVIGKGITLAVDESALPENSKAHALYIGLKNILQDTHAGESDPATAKALAEKKLAALMSGEVRVSSTREGDPVRAEAMRIATDIVKAALRKKGKKLSDVDPKALRQAAATLLTRDAGIMEKAKARVAETKAVDVDVSDLVS